MNEGVYNGKKMAFCLWSLFAEGTALMLSTRRLPRGVVTSALSPGAPTPVCQNRDIFLINISKLPSAGTG